MRCKLDDQIYRQRSECLVRDKDCRKNFDPHLQGIKGIHKDGTHSQKLQIQFPYSFEKSTCAYTLQLLVRHALSSQGLHVSRGPKERIKDGQKKGI
jgi:hypothetical protein